MRFVPGGKMKTDTVFKRSFNDALDLVSRLALGEALPSESAMSARLGVSRTTVRKVLTALEAQGIISGSGRNRVLRSLPAVQRFPMAETVPTAAQVQDRFMEWMLRGNTPPWHADQRARPRAEVRRCHHEHPRVPQPLPAVRPDREAAERRVDSERVHAGLRARALRDSRDVRVAVGADRRAPP